MKFHLHIVMIFIGCLLISRAEGAPEGEPASGVQLSYDFETVKAMTGWTGYEGAPITLSMGEGAMGSKGFLRIGPHPGKWVGASTGKQFIAGHDTWIGFSARIPAGGRIKLLLADGKQKKNVTKEFVLPKDGAWANCLLQVRLVEVTPGTPVTRLSFFVDNPSRAPLYYDIDNVVVGTGIRLEPPQPVPALSAAQNDGFVTLSWNPPEALAGLHEYRVYRGMNAEFSRDERHRLAVTTKTSVTDGAFAHGGEYFYAVRAVDFAGNEGQDSKAVRVEVK